MIQNCRFAFGQHCCKIRKKHFQWKRIHHFQVQTCEVKIQKLFANLEQKRRLKRKSPPAQYLRISIGCRKGSRCGQNFHKKSGSTGRILNKYIYQFKQTLGSSRPSAAGPKCTPDPNKTLSSLQKFSWVTWVSYGIRVLCSPLDVLIYVTIWTNMSEKGLVVWAPFTQEVRPHRKEEF